MKDNHKTVVIFRVWKKEPKTVIALFPEDMNNKGECQSYEKVGQHGGANYAHCMKSTTPSTPDQHLELFQELESIGYNLEIKKRW